MELLCSDPSHVRSDITNFIGRAAKQRWMPTLDAAELVPDKLREVLCNDKFAGRTHVAAAEAMIGLVKANTDADIKEGELSIRLQELELRKAEHELRKRKTELDIQERQPAPVNNGINVNILTIEQRAELEIAQRRIDDLLAKLERTAARIALGPGRGEGADGGGGEDRGAGGPVEGVASLDPAVDDPGGNAARPLAAKVPPVTFK